LSENMSSRRLKESIPPATNKKKMKRLIFILLAVVSLMTGTSAISSSQTVPARAAESTASYGDVATWGMNLDGLNFYREGLTSGGIGHGRYSYEYIKPTTQEMDYFKSKGMTTYRVAFLWERVQHSLHSDLDPEDIGYLDDVVNAAVARGLQVYIVPFDYGRYYDVSTSQTFVLGSSQLPYNAFDDLWTKLATHFKGRVWGYDLMNEPYSMSIGTLDGRENWKQAAQSAINAIRQIDTSTTIIVPGYWWSNSLMWPSQSDNLKTLVDPSDNLIFEAHCYFDSDTSGTYSGGIPSEPLCPSNEGRGEYLLSPFVDWLRANGKIGLIGEMGVPSDQFWLDVFKPALDYTAANQDVLVSIQIHTAGPWWPSTYTMCLDPTQDASGNYIDKPQMVLLGDYIGSTSPPSSTNRAPVLDAIGNKTANEGAALTLTVSGSDVDGDVLTYSASNLPAGAAFNAATLTFSWTPSYEQAGVHADIRFQVSDGELIDFENIKITVVNVVQPDVDGDGHTNVLDMIRIGQRWNETGASGWIREDINEDGTVSVLDATLVGQHWTG
jgi:hypothetical protein